MAYTRSSDTERACCIHLNLWASKRPPLNEALDASLHHERESWNNRRGRGFLNHRGMACRAGYRISFSAISIGYIQRRR